MVNECELIFDITDEQRIVKFIPAVSQLVPEYPVLGAAVHSLKSEN